MISQAGEVRSVRIEALRAIAALGVLLGHVYLVVLLFGAEVTRATFLRRLVFDTQFAVYLFFALTGYLLFWPLAREHFSDGGALNYRRYAANRALRILPLYFTCVIVLLVVQEHGGSFDQWTHFLTLTENFSRSTIASVDPPMWSLVVEVHFYILLPLIAAGVARLSAKSLRRAAALLVFAGCVSAALDAVLVVVPRAANPLWRYSLPTTLFWFIAGMLVALTRLSWEQNARRLGGLLSYGDVWLVAALLLWLVAVWQNALLGVTAIAGFLAVGGCVLPLRAGPVMKLLEWRPLALLGICSYSLYLWHVPVVEALYRHHVSASTAGLLLASAPLCCAIAVASYRVVERPFLVLRRRWAAGSAPRTASG